MAERERAGVLLVDKPPGPTSHDVVQHARRVLGTRRIGHTGTLDPFASGLLVLCVGPATRIADQLSALPKRYEAAMTLGVATATDDPTGDVVATADDWQTISTDRIRDALLGLRGAILQRPPVYSAKKSGGVRHYRLAREGRAVEPEPVPVVVHELEITSIRLPIVRFVVRCSAGTYIRALARDAGAALGVPAHLSTLRRTAIGGLVVTDAVPLERLTEAPLAADAWRTPLAVLAHLPRFDVDDGAATDLAHGRATAAPTDAADCDNAVAAHRNRLLALVDCSDDWLRPRKVFP